MSQALQPRAELVEARLEPAAALRPSEQVQGQAGSRAKSRLRAIAGRRFACGHAQAEAAGADAGLKAKLAETLQAVTKLKGEVELVAPGSLPNDGKVIADERTYG